MTSQHTSSGSATSRFLAAVLATLAVNALFVGPVSAHGSSHAPDIPQEAGLLTLILGLIIIVTGIYRARHQSSDQTKSLALLLTGFATSILGSVLLVELSTVDTLTASQLPFARSWYGGISAVLGSTVALGSLALTRTRWPRRPRYAALGLLTAAWIAYTSVMPTLVGSSRTPVSLAGYIIVLSLPVTVAYILWKDARTTVVETLADRTARLFGLAIGGLMTVFFLFSTGMVGMIPDSTQGISWTYSRVAVVQIANPLVYWPSVEWWFPHIPFGGYLSVGMVLILGLLGTLIGLNAATAARQWRRGNGSSGTTAAPSAVAVAGPNACCCCGPVLAELAVVALGPSLAAPLYWVFVDIASPVGAIFFTTSVVLLTATLVSAGPNPTAGPRGGEANA